ncbi:DUF4214 domain-containing protein [Pseudomonas sp. 21LCFQ010]|uniref:beta strand repeat-containing protein n=1 Tax=Pseudomonas sp. 21LCFQ010 TaxID=2957506 RepID=UPI002096FC31|nr:DUF4214 domain-containing protein [Pseudomonas sp. 21LCFQ010]MCO8164183.1 DUF4214 domain-containing protein [Pseudomonas sp. 21LCFQ010]
MAAATYFDQVQQLYIAYFGRPADPIGQAFWANTIDQANGSIAAVLAGFSASAESQALFGNKSTIDKVTAIYQNAFNRAPEPAGLAFWVAQIDSGRVTQAQASWTIQQNAGAGDAAAVQNKLTAAKAFTAQIDTTAEIQGYQGTGAADVARAFLQTVNSNNATATAAVAGAASALANAVANGGTGSTFNLTTGVDTLTGTSNNDTFVADNTGTNKVLSAADTINGGAGVDTLKVFLAAGDTSFVNPTLNSVENVTINGGAVTAYTAAAGTTGLTIEAPVSVGATYTVAGQAVTLKGFTGTAGTTTIASAAADTAANVTLNGWGTAAAVQTVALTGANVATANLTATGANSVIALNGTAALRTLNVAGDKNVQVAVDATGSAALTSVNASTATGNVNVGLASGAVLAAGFTFTGGAGNDILSLSATGLTNLTAGSQLDGGAGNDTLFINNAGALVAADYAKLNAVKNFESLGLGSAQTVDASQLTSFKSFTLNTAVETINNVGTGSTVVFGANNTNSVLTSAVGTNAVELVAGQAGAAGVTVAGLTLTGLNTIGLTSNGTSANTVGLKNVDNSSVTVKGATDLTLTLAAGTATGSKVDASAFTGKLTVTGSDFADILIGGAGADTFNVGKGGDTITTGAGADVVKFTSVDQATAANLTTVTDFTAGTDKLNIAGIVAGTPAVTATAVNVSTATTLAQALDLAAAADGSTNSQVKFFQFQSNTYVVVDNTAGATFAATDAVVKLSGTVNLTATDFVLA